MRARKMQAMGMFGGGVSTYTISGIVTDSVNPVESVTVALGAYSAVTAADGTYTITGIPANTSGTLTGTKTGYTFSTVSIAAMSGNLTGQNLSSTYALRAANTEAASLLAGWILGEASGLVADNYLGVAARDGAYSASGITKGVTGIGDGSTAVTLDGTAGFVNIYSAELASSFNPANPWTVLVWVKMTATEWTDGAVRYFLHLSADGNNLIRIRKSSVNNRLDMDVRAGGTFATTVITGQSSTNWMCLALRRNGSNLLHAFIDGISPFPAGTSISGTWAGSIANTLCNIGANTSTPSNPHKGQIGQVWLWQAALSNAQILDLASGAAAYP
jgi:hypothetical protein